MSGDESGKKSPLMTPGEAARALHVHVRTLTRWEQAGKLRAIRTLGGHRRYLTSEITAILDGWKKRAVVPEQRQGEE